MKFTGIFSALLFLTNALLSQAPIPPAYALNSLSRIDSLTMELLSEIPCHQPSATSNDSSLQEFDFEQRMRLLCSDIPYQFHPLVQKYIDFYTRLGETYWDNLHGRMATYFPLFEESLDRNGLPIDLKYVSIIESNLNPNAVSWCGATGLWQFMPYTAKDMGMQITPQVDERKSIVEATETACQYFLQSQSLFNDWLLSIASYNCGAGNVKKAMRYSGGKTSFWDIMPFLPKETQSYVPKFIAVAYVLNFTSHAYHAENNNSEVLVVREVDASLSLPKLATYLGSESEAITGFNRHFLAENTHLSNGAKLVLPYQLSMNFCSDYDSSCAFALLSPNELNKVSTVSTGRSITHVVSSGQTLSHIARRYGVSVSQIKTWNHLRSDIIRVGQRLTIYR